MASCAILNAEKDSTESALCVGSHAHKTSEMMALTATNLTPTAEVQATLFGQRISATGTTIKVASRTVPSGILNAEITTQAMDVALAPLTAQVVHMTLESHARRIHTVEELVR